MSFEEIDFRIFNQPTDLELSFFYLCWFGGFYPNGAYSQSELSYIMLKKEEKP